MEHVILVATFGALLVAERLPALRFEPSAVFRPYVGSDLVYLTTGALALGLAVRMTFERWSGILAPASLPLTTSLTSIAAAIVLYDLGAWVSHRLLHRVDVLWRLHKVHHSSRVLDWLATFRAHPLEHLLRHLASPAALILLGFPLERAVPERSA